MKLYLSQDAAARAVGADATAAAIRVAAPTLPLLRTGSRGMVWLEPLLEVDTADGRLAFGPVTAADVAGLFADGSPDPTHPLCLGPTDALPWMAGQTRLTFARCGLIAPLDTAAYVAHGGLRGLHQALSMPPDAIIAQITESGLRGRGGAGFPTGIKWQTVRDAPASQKHIVCNADEGDSGTFADRMLMEGDPFCLIEGMVIAGLATGATHGFIYLRSEYPDAARLLRAAHAAPRAQPWLCPDILGWGPALHKDQ
ncbi:MAG: formate dehydrogenase, partial [Pararhodobacter sp.]|nr:formate dehydrogenase [Pararhodobacter sp.]